MKTINKKCLFAIVIALTAYIVKNIFVGADSDEGYGIVLSYRLVMGDRLLLQMWEPHQTSAIFTALFTAPFIWLTGGGTFLNIYLRIIYFLIHGIVTVMVYRTFRACVLHEEKEKAFWISLVYFVSSPKCIYIPEYSNLHMWFFTLLCLSAIWYDSVEFPLKSNRYVIPAVAGIFLVCDVLAYPSMILLFPIFFAFFWRRSADKRMCAFFVLPCILGGVLFCGYLLTYMTIGEILQMIPHILDDGSHQSGSWEKVADWLSDFGGVAVNFLITGLAAGGLAKLYCRIRKKRRSFSCSFLFFFFLLQTVYQFYCWFTSDYNASYPHLLYLFILLSGIYCYYKSGKKGKSGIYLILFSFAAYFSVMVLSNWSPVHLMPYFILGVLGGLVYWGDYFKEQAVLLAERALPVLCGILVFSNVFGYCWLYIGGGWIHSSILTVGGIHKDGLRKGILTSYMSAYQYNSDLSAWREAVPEGSTCLFVGPQQVYYMFGDSKIAAPSTISTPVYDESLLDYWDINPDRYPDVVVVESWFGDMRGAAEGSFIRQWLEEEFQAVQVTDYAYITVYRR